MSLTDQDKLWFIEKFDGLDVKIDGVESRLEAKIAGVESRLESKIANLDVKIDGVESRLEAKIASLDAKVVAVESKLEEKIDALDIKIVTTKAELLEKIERVETNLLTEFHKWASPNDLKLRSHNAAIHALDLKIDALVERIEKLERRASYPSFTRSSKTSVRA